MNSLVLCVATLRWSCWLDSIKSWYRTAGPAPMSLHVVCGKEILPAYQECYEGTRQEVLGMIHDDVNIFEVDWDMRVRQEFDDPTVGCVGFFGAKRHGREDIYRSPYDLPQLGRFGCLSNMRNAEQHGARFAGVCDVAVLDGMAIFVRRKILDRTHGWPIGTPIGYFCYDYWLCCEVRRQGYRIRLVGIDFEHLGGRSSTLSALPDSHAKSHLWLYQRSQDVLPFAVE